MSDDERWARIARRADLIGPGPWTASADGVEGSLADARPSMGVEGSRATARPSMGVDLVLVRASDGALKAYEGRCPHQGALLGEGEIVAGELVCRNHRWRFALDSGRRVGGPECLRACPVRERGEHVEAVVAPLVAADARRQRRVRQPEDLPGPPGLPVVGNVLEARIPILHLVLERWAERYGTPYVFRLGRRALVVFDDPDTIDAVLRARPERFRRYAAVDPVFREMGIDGVFNAEGAAWRPQRRLAMEALSHRHLKGFYPTLRKVTERLVARWDRAARAGDGAIDIVADLMRFTVDVTTSLAFGHDTNTLEQGDDVIQKRLAHVFPALDRRLYAILPYWRWVKLPADRQLERALAEIRTFLAGCIAAARRALADDPARVPSTFLEAMLVARDADGAPYAEDLLFGNAMSMLLAGEDTTAHTLGWAVHELCDHPGAVAALRAEADACFGDDVVPREIEAANKLEHALAVANETMRLRPVAPFIISDANEDTVVGDVAIARGGSVIALTRRAATRDAAFAGADTFRPERWLDARRPAGDAHDASASFPFGSGPRICPGRTLALLEMRVVLATLFKRFDVERVGRRDAVHERYAFTMHATGLAVRLRLRA